MKILGIDLDNIFPTVYKIVNNEDGEQETILEFDSIEEANISATSTVTKYPIEKGFERTDGKYNQPNVIEMIGRISKNRMFGQILDFDSSDLIGTIESQLETHKRIISDLTIYTRTSARQHYTLREYSIPETIDNYGMFVVEMTFEEIVSDFATVDVSNPSLSNTESAGVVQTEVL